VTTAAPLADEDFSEGLNAAAHECLHRRVGPGEVLAYVLEDSAAGASVAFVVLKLFVPRRRR
jgi:hypothetical protein